MTPEYVMVLIERLCGVHADTTKAVIVQEFKDFQDHRAYRMQFIRLSTTIAGFCKSFTHAQEMVSLWAGIPVEYL